LPGVVNPGFHNHPSDAAHIAYRSATPRPGPALTALRARSELFRGHADRPVRRTRGYVDLGLAKLRYSGGLCLRPKPAVESVGG
jgi:hypothetical protein